MKSMEKPLKIGFLITHRSFPKETKDDLDVIRLKRSIVYTWNDFPKRKKELIPLKRFLLFQALGYCNVLTTAVRKFRDKFGLPEDGIPFKEYEKLICRVGSGNIYKFDAIPQMQGGKFREAQKFLEKFVKENIVAKPLTIYLETIFFAGFVDIVPYQDKELFIQIPFIQDYITGTVKQYRSPVAVFINSSAVTKSQVHKLIENNWPYISLYFKKYPDMADIKIIEDKLHALSMKMQGKSSSQILDYFNDKNIEQGKEAVDKEDDAMRQELHRTKKLINKLICRRKKTM